MQTEIIDTIKNMFGGADERDWEKVKETLAEHVLLDYSALSGSPASMLTPDDIVTAWKVCCPDLIRHIINPLILT